MLSTRHRSLLIHTRLASDVETWVRDRRQAHRAEEHSSWSGKFLLIFGTRYTFFRSRTAEPCAGASRYAVAASFPLSALSVRLLPEVLAESARQSAREQRRDGIPDCLIRPLLDAAKVDSVGERLKSCGFSNCNNPGAVRVNRAERGE